MAAANAEDELVIRTGEGTVRVTLRRDVAPETCARVAQLAADGLYDGCCFYRAESFCVQGGLRRPDGGAVKSPYGGVPLEYRLKNTKWTVSLARWDDPSSGTSEFFVNLGDNANLDRYGDSGWALGFTVFGEVRDEASRAAVERISRLPTAAKGGMSMLREAVRFESVRVERRAA